MISSDSKEDDQVIYSEICVSLQSLCEVLHSPGKVNFRIGLQSFY